MLTPYILFTIGLILIIKGGDLFVDAATWIARITHLPEVLIGATIVSLATTFPETSVSVISVIHNQPSMAVGNAIGSTICNTGLILGLYNLIKPSNVNSRLFKLKGLLMVFYIIVFWFLSKDGVIDTYSSYLLLLMLLFFIIFNLIIIGYKKSQGVSKSMAVHVEPSEYAREISKFILGILIIIFGSNLLVTHGVTIAKLWGVPSSIISLSMIALGTSLPELVTAITALLKDHADLSIGNILGANILNITMVLGLSSQFRPLEISRQSYFLDIPVSIAINMLLILPSLYTKKITRLQSALLLAGYILYISVLFYIF